MKAIIVNRFGDFGIYFSLLVMFFYFKSFDFGVIFNLVYMVNLQPDLVFMGFSVSRIDFIVFFLFLGAIGKSAQLGLHT